jgi:hypothetical protein
MGAPIDGLRSRGAAAVAAAMVAGL